MANKQVSPTTELAASHRKESEWIVARAVVLEPEARAWFISRQFPPGMFLCPIARSAVVWSMVNRKSVPAALETLLASNPDGRESFIEFIGRESVPENGDEDFCGPSTPTGNRLRTLREVREHAHLVHTAYLEGARR